MIDFRRLDLSRKAEYDAILRSCGERGCEYSFANLFLWGRQTAAFHDGCLVFFSHFNGRSVYPFPVGPGDLKGAVDAVLEDARQRGIPCRLTSLTPGDLALLEQWYPGRFVSRCDRSGFDYVYAIDDLADLKGRKFQQKRNHLHRFEDACPDWHCRVLDEATLPMARNLMDNWFYRQQTENPHEDFQMEKAAIRRALEHFHALELEGLLLMAGGEPVAVTMGSPLSDTIFDVHFEKAREDVPGAYNAINREFARYLRDRYPRLQYLNREDDLGLAGLRKSKLSYCPHHLVEKCWAHLREDGYVD